MAKRVGVGEGLVSEVMGFEVAPKCFDVVQIRCGFGQPFDDEPVSARSACRPGEFACVDWAIVLDRHDGPGGLSRLGTVKPVELFEMGDAVTAARGLGGVCRGRPSGGFFRSALERCERLMLPPSRTSISARRRAMVRFRRSATGAASNGMNILKSIILIYFKHMNHCGK